MKHYTESIPGEQGLSTGGAGYPVEDQQVSHEG